MTKEKNKTELPQVVEGELQARLIKLREDAGFDVPQMADALCLSEDVIINLENEAFELLPEPPYVRGYLRNYAKLSNDEDATELIKRYEALRGADASELEYQNASKAVITNTSSKRLSPIWGQLILLGILAGAIALITSIPAVNGWINNTWKNFSSQLGPTDSSNNPSLLGELPVPTPLLEEQASSNTNPETNSATTETSNNNNSSSVNNTLADTQSSSAATETTNSTDTATTEKTEAATTTEAQTDTKTEIATDTTAATETTTDSDVQEVPAVSADGTINIKLVFNKEVWLRIKDKESKTVFEGLNKAETEKTIDLKKPLTFRVGNAQGLSLFIDNEAVDITSYINGSIANFTLE